MRKLKLLALVALACVLSPLALVQAKDAPASTRSTTPPPSMEQLQKENRALRDQVSKLENELKEAEAKLKRFSLVPSIPEGKSPFVLPNPIPPGAPFRFGDGNRSLVEPAIPKQWKEREYNGTKFYLVPLAR